MKSQWEKFKHRTLTKIFLGYAVVAWVLIQVIEAVLPTFETPLWVAQTITFLLILGFPIAIIVGWASEKLPNMPTDSEDASVAKPAHMTSRRRLVWIGIASCTIVGLFGFYMMPFIFDQQAFDLSQSSSVQVRPSLERSIRNRIILGDTGSRVWGSRSDIDISPDGNYLVFSEFSPPNIILKLKDMTSFDQPKELTQFNMNQNNGYPMFSEDGQWIYYHLADSLRRIRIEGGTPQVAIDSGVAPSGVAVRNETIVYSDSNSRALLAFDLNTGLSQAIFENQEEGVSFQYTWPQFIPGIEKLVATRGARGSFDNSSIDVINLETAEIQTVAPIGYHGRYANSGHIVFARGDSLWATPIDFETLMPVGNTIPVIFDLELYESYGNAGFAISQTGRLIYVSGALDGENGRTLIPALVDRNGDEEHLQIEPGLYGSPQVSPDGKMLSFSIRNESDLDVWVYDFSSGTIGRRTFNGDSSRAIWSSNGQRLIYRCGASDVCSTAANGTDSASILYEGLESNFPNFQTSDGLLAISFGSVPNVHLSSSSVSGQPENILENLELSRSRSIFSRLSPDEKWLAYSSDETGRQEIYVRPFPNIRAGKWQISRNGGNWPLWNKNSNELFWWNAQSREAMSGKFSVSMDNDASTISFENPRTLFSGNYNPMLWPYWDYLPEIDKFVLISQPNESVDSMIDSQTNLYVIENWFSELHQEAPADR